jgi:hypothetical protein
MLADAIVSNWKIEYGTMAKQLSKTEIVGKLRQAEVQFAHGKTVPEVCRDRNSYISPGH